MDNCVSFSLYIRHSPETEVNVRSTFVLCEKNPKYSQLADKTYLNLKFIYIQTKVFFRFSKISIFGIFLGLKTWKMG